MAEKLSSEEINHIAKLSKLELTSEEIETYSNQLSSILGYVEQLQEVDTSSVQSSANITGLVNVYRKDEVEESGISYQEIELNAPKFKDGFFKVPGIFN